MKKVLLLQALLILGAVNTKTKAGEPTSSNPPAKLHRFFTESAMQFTPNISDENMRTTLYVLFSGSYQGAVNGKAYTMTQEQYNKILALWNVKEVYGNEDAYATGSQMKEMYRSYIAKKTGQPTSVVTDEALQKIATATMFEPMPHNINGIYDIYGFTDEGTLMISSRDTSYLNERAAYFLWNGVKVYYASTGCGNITDKRTSSPVNPTIYKEKYDYAREMYASNPEPNVNVNVNVNNTFPQGNNSGVPVFIQPQQQAGGQVVKVEFPEKIKVEGMVLNNIFAGISAASSVFGNFQQARTNKLLTQDLIFDMFGGSRQQIVPQPIYSNTWFPGQNGGGGYVNNGGFQGGSGPNWGGNSGNGYYNNGYNNGYTNNYGNNSGNQYGNQWSSNPRQSGYMDQMNWIYSMNQRSMYQNNQDQQLMQMNGGVLPIMEGLGTSRFRQPTGNPFVSGQSYGNNW